MQTYAAQADNIQNNIKQHGKGNAVPDTRCEAGQPNLLKLLQSPIEQPYDIYILLHQNVSKAPKNACFNEFKGNYN